MFQFIIDQTLKIIVIMIEYVLKKHEIERKILSKFDDENVIDK